MDEEPTLTDIDRRQRKIRQTVVKLRDRADLSRADAWDVIRDCRDGLMPGDENILAEVERNMTEAARLLRHIDLIEYASE
jgi:hypothetical protein